jgi:DNA-binding response OmpR family regulator
MMYASQKSFTLGLIYWIDDEPHAVHTYAQKLSMEGFDVEVMENPSEALIKLAVSVPRAIILDIWMPSGFNGDMPKELKDASPHKMGIAFIQYLIGKEMNVPLVVVTGVLDNAIRQELMQFKDMLGERILTKPPRPKELVETVKVAAGGQ